VDTLDAIGALAAKQFGVDPSRIDVDAPIQQLGVDSLGFLEFLFELEEHFDISIEQDDAKEVRTIRDLAALIDRLREASAPKPS
jgi:acyl carrier protein